MSAPITLKSLTTSELTLNDYASIAADALAAINAINQAWRANALAGGYAAHFKAAPTIPDHLYAELLNEIVRFDEDPSGSLAELNFQEEMQAERELELMPRASLLTDAEWDFATSRGLSA